MHLIKTWLTFFIVKVPTTFAHTYTSFLKYYDFELSVSHIFLSNGFLVKTLFHLSIIASYETETFSSEHYSSVHSACSRVGGRVTFFVILVIAKWIGLKLRCNNDTS